MTDELERRPLPAIPDDLPRWLYREPQGLNAGLPLEQAVRQAEVPASRGYVWMALEAGAMRRIRRHLIEEKGLLPEQMVTRGYWKLGTSDHPDGRLRHGVGMPCLLTARPALQMFMIGHNHWTRSKGV